MKTQSVRIPTDMMDRVRALAPQMVRVGPPLSTPDALRVVVEAGIRAVEEDVGTSSPPESATVRSKFIRWDELTWLPGCATRCPTDPTVHDGIKAGQPVAWVDGKVAAVAIPAPDPLPDFHLHEVKDGVAEYRGCVATSGMPAPVGTIAFTETK